MIFFFLTCQLQTSQTQGAVKVPRLLRDDHARRIENARTRTVELCLDARVDVSFRILKERLFAYSHFDFL